MTKPVLVVDVDDVLAPHYELLTEHFNQTYNMDLTPADVHHFRAIDSIMVAFEVDRPTIINNVHTFLLSESFYGEPIEGAVAAIQQLQAKYHLIIITARPQVIKAATERWLKQHFAGAFQNIDFVGAQEWGMGRMADKRSRLVAMKADTLIDDALSHCQVASELGLKTLLFGDYSWNQADELPSSVQRAKDWQEVLDLLV